MLFCFLRKILKKDNGFLVNSQVQFQAGEFPLGLTEADVNQVETLERRFPFFFFFFFSSSLSLSIYISLSLSLIFTTNKDGFTDIIVTSSYVVTVILNTQTQVSSELSFSSTLIFLQAGGDVI